MPATMPYGIQVEVAVAVGREADWGVWDTGTWGVNVWGDPDTALGDWVDVTCEVEDGLALHAGADESDGVVTRWEAATAAFTLLGERWDPWGGPYAGWVGPQLPVRVRWRSLTDRTRRRAAGLIPDLRVDPDGWAHAFEGAVDDEGWEWEPAPPGGTGQAQVVATDYTSDLTAWDPPDQDPPVGDGETASARVTRILDFVEWPAGRRAVTAGGVTLQPSKLGGEAWGQLLDVADADLALMWVRRDGFLAYVPQGRVAVGTELAGRLAVCPVGSDDIQIVDLSRSHPHVVRNVVNISRAERDGVEGDTPVLVTRRDESSIGRYRSHGYTRTNLVHDDDVWSETVAEAVLAANAWPSLAPSQAVVSSELGDDRAAPLLLSLEANHRFDVVDPAGFVWHEMVLGWDVEVRYGATTGTLSLADVSMWVPAARWDTGRWDIDPWGIGGPT